MHVMDTPFRVCLVGCGRISERHLLALKALGEVGRIQLLGVCDTDIQRAEDAAKLAGTDPFNNYVEMLRSQRPDWVSICTPSGLHPKLGMIAADHGCHVVSEKPLGTNLADIDQLIACCQKNQVRLFCVKQLRLLPALQMLKRAINKGRFGRILFAQTNVFWQRPQSYYDEAAWRGTMGLDGGVLLNQASHYVDALYWLIGEVESVAAITGRLGRTIESHDTASASVRFRRGTIGSINVTMLTYPKNLEGSITILGETATVKIGGIGLNRLESWQFADWDDDDKTAEESGGVVRAAPETVGHLGYYHHVIDVLHGREPLDVDGTVARKSVELALAVHESAGKGVCVQLPLT